MQPFVIPFQRPLELVPIMKPVWGILTILLFRSRCEAVYDWVLELATVFVSPGAPASDVGSMCLSPRLEKSYDKSQGMYSTR